MMAWHWTESAKQKLRRQIAESRHAHLLFLTESQRARYHRLTQEHHRPKNYALRRIG